MKAFLTGATGFIGGQVARTLRDRGDDVVALVRSPAKASALTDLGCELVEGDLSDGEAIRRGVTGVDAVFHIGGVYKVGVPSSEHAAMEDANVGGTERVIDAAVDAGVRRIVYVSTVACFGDTHGKVVDESYERPDRDFLSAYDESKFRAHEVAVDRAGKGAPVVIVQPGAVYGPGDHSEIGNMIDQARTGKLKAKMFPETGFMFGHVEDIAGGMVLAHDRGEVGEHYVLAGEQGTMGDLVDKVSALSGRKPPRFAMPVALMKISAPFGSVVGPLLGFPPNLRELIKTSDGVTCWASDAKARRELGFAPRDFDTGLRQTLEASG